MAYYLTKYIGIAVVLVIAGWMLKTWLNHQERMKELSMTNQNLGSSDQRLARVEQAVEAIAIEIERVSEGQRYLTRLLGDRPPLPPPSVRDQSMNTPH
jgi:hypothetical protein